MQSENIQSTISKNSMHTEKYDHLLNEDQKFVNKIMDQHDITIKQIADKIHMEPDLVRYQLREAINYRQDVHTRIVEVLKKEGYVTCNKEVCDKLKDNLLDFSSVLNGTIAIITRSVRDKIQDMHLDESEKKLLKDQIRNQLNRVTDEFNDLLVTIDLK